MFRFESAEVLHLLWLVPIFWIIVTVLVRRREKQSEKVYGKKALKFLTASASSSKRRWKLFFELLVFALLVIAYARPQFGQSVQDVKSEGVELIFAVDVSNSMMTEDVKPNRLELAKKTLQRVMERSAGHRIGLVAFAGSSALIAPMTSDYSALHMFIDSLSPSSVGTQGTVFARALQTAADSFKRGGLGKEEGIHATQVIVVVSDGEDNEPGALKVAEELKQKGFHVYTIAVGTRKGGPIPVRNDRGVLEGYKKDGSGTPVVSTVKEGLLKEIAEAGGGGFAFATFGGKEVELLLNDLKRLNKAEFEREKMTNFDEHYGWFLAFALLIAMTELLISERKSLNQEWKGRLNINA